MTNQEIIDKFVNILFSKATDIKDLDLYLIQEHIDLIVNYRKAAERGVYI